MFDHGLTDTSSFKLTSRLDRRDSKGQPLDHINSQEYKMSNHYYPPATSVPEDEAYYTDPNYAPHTIQAQQFNQFQPQYPQSTMPEQQYYTDSSQYPPQQPQFQQMPSYQYQMPQQQAWSQQTLPSNYQYHQQDMSSFPQYSIPEEQPVSGPSGIPAVYLSPELPGRPRLSRSGSNASSAQSVSRSDISRSVSPNASEMARWGYKNEEGSWSCSYPGCSSRSTFHRGCDLRKHYKRHTKSLFCRHEGCPQASEGGFSSKKDRARHEAKHNPNIICEFPGCERLFSRQDNMKDHVRRVHKRRIT